MSKPLVAATLTTAILFALVCPSQSQESWAQQQPSYFSSVERSDWQILGAGAILSLMALSTESSQAATSNLERATLLDGPMDVGSVYGSTWTIAGLTLGMGAVGYLGHSPEFKGAAWDLTRSLAITGLIVGTVKMSVDRGRPNGGGQSFPSGHTAVAFTAAPVIGAHFGARYGTLAYGMATLTALGRMEDNKHYFSDVIAGATIGTLVSRIVTRRNSRLSLFGSPGGFGAVYDF